MPPSQSTLEHSRIATLLAATAAVWVLGAVLLESHLTRPEQRVGYWNSVGHTLPVPLVLAAVLGNVLVRRPRRS